MPLMIGNIMATSWNWNCPKSVFQFYEVNPPSAAYDQIVIKCVNVSLCDIYFKVRNADDDDGLF